MPLLIKNEGRLLDPRLIKSKNSFLVYFPSGRIMVSGS
jgi:hypothetical protein